MTKYPMRTRIGLAACLSLFCVIGSGSERRPDLAFSPSKPVLEGIINLPDRKACLLDRICYPPLVEGVRDDNVEVVKINPAEGIVELMVFPGMRPLLLTMSNTPPVGISLENARLTSVLRFYGELKGRSILHPDLDSMKLTMRSSARTRAEAVEALEGALKRLGLAVVPDGTKFIQVVPQAQATLVAPRSLASKELSEAGEKPQTILPPGSMDFRNCGAAQVLTVYAELAGRELEEADQAPRIAVGAISFLSQTPLTKEEARHALDTLFAWRGFQVIEVAEKGLRVTRTSGSRR